MNGPMSSEPIVERGGVGAVNSDSPGSLATGGLLHHEQKHKG